MAQFKEFYKKEVIPVLTKEFGYDNPMRVPKITKVVLNMGVGEALTDKKVLENAANDLNPDLRTKSSDHEGSKVGRCI